MKNYAEIVSDKPRRLKVSRNRYFQKIFQFSQINPTRCTNLLSTYTYFTSLHVSGNHVPIIWRNQCIYVTMVFATLYVWFPVCWLEWNGSYRVTNTSVA